jgi:hypothetical protein
MVRPPRGPRDDAVPLRRILDLLVASFPPLSRLADHSGPHHVQLGYLRWSDRAAPFDLAAAIVRASVGR